MSDEKYSIKTESPVTFSDSVSNLDRSITFHVGGKKRLKITKDGFYVDERLVANDTEIYEAFKDFLNSCSGKETQDDRYYKAIKRNIEKEKKDIFFSGDLGLRYKIKDLRNKGLLPEPEDELQVLALAMVAKKDKETGPAWSETSEEIAKIMVAFHNSL